MEKLSVVVGLVFFFRIFDNNLRMQCAVHTTRVFFKKDDKKMKLKNGCK